MPVKDKVFKKEVKIMSVTQGKTPHQAERMLAILEIDLKKQIDGSQNPDTDIGVAGAYVSLGNYHRQLENYSEAQSSYDHAAQIFTNLNDHESLAAVDLKRIENEIALGDFEKVNEIYRNSSLGHSGNDDIKAKMVFLGIQACLGFLNVGDLDSAKQVYTSLDGLFFPPDFVAQIYPQALPNLAELLRRLGEKTFEAHDYINAIFYSEIRLSLKDEEPTNDAIKSRVECLKILGKSYLEMGRKPQLEEKYDLAYEWFAMGLNAFELANDKSSRVQALEKIARVFLALGQLDRADEYFGRSAEVAGEAEQDSSEIWPFFKLEPQELRIAKPDTATPSPGSTIPISIEMDIRNAGNLTWRKGRRFRFSYKCEGQHFSMINSGSLELGNFLPPQSYMEVKDEISMGLSDGEYKMGCSIRNLHWEEPSVWVWSSDSITFSSQGNTYSLTTAAGQESEDEKIQARDENTPTIKKPKPVILPAVNVERPTVRPFFPSPNMEPKNMEPKSMKAPRKVFLSYSSKDTKVVKRIRSRLEKAGIPVTIDTEALHGGENIESFIKNSVRQNDVTLSVVSKNSLLSGWVSEETMNAFSAEEYAGKKFLPCYIGPESDSDLHLTLYDAGFTNELIAHIDKELAVNEKEMAERNRLRSPTDDLDSKRRRYLKLRGNLPTIINRLLEWKCINLSGPEFNKGMKQIIEELKL